MAERRSLLVVALAALLAFSGLAIWARAASPAPWEPGVLVVLGLDTGPWADAWHAVNMLGNLPIWAPAVAVLALLVGAARGALAGLLVAASVLADGVAAVAKVLVERGRPGDVVVDGLFGPDSFSYPSGHVVRAVALAAALAWVLVAPRLRLPAALASALAAGLVMGYARVALGVHWPTDALGGLLLGLAWFTGSALLIDGRLRLGPRL